MYPSESISILPTLFAEAPHLKAAKENMISLIISHFGIFLLYHYGIIMSR